MTILEERTTTQPSSSFGSRLGTAARSQWGLLLAFGLLLIFPFAFSILTGNPLDSGIARFWQGQLIAFFILAVFAMSYDLLLGYTGILSFGHAAFFGGGAYAMALFLNHAVPSIASQYQIFLPGGVNITTAVLFVVAVLLVLLVSVGMGLLFSAVSLRVRGVYFAMITLAIADAFHILSKATDFVKWTGADEGLHGVAVPLWINPTQHRLRFYFIALFFLIFMFFLLRRVVKSPTGHVLIALRENENRARMIGYNPITYRTLAFVLSAVAAGLAGAMYSLWNMSATPTMTSAVTTINVLIMVILGRMVALVGRILGSGLMQIFGQFLYEWFGPRWPLVFGLIFIALVMFLPYGIVGTYRMRSFQWRQGWNRLLRLLGFRRGDA